MKPLHHEPKSVVLRYSSLNLVFRLYQSICPKTTNQQSFGRLYHQITFYHTKMKSTSKKLVVSSQALREACSRLNLQPNSFLKTAWAITSHVHTDSDNVNLADLHQSDSHEDGLYVTMRNLHSGPDPVTVGAVLHQVSQSTVAENAGVSLRLSDCPTRFLVTVDEPPSSIAHIAPEELFYTLVLSDQESNQCHINVSGAAHEQKMEAVVATFRIICHQLLSPSISLDLGIDQIDLLPFHEIAQLSRWNNNIQSDSQECIHTVVTAHAFHRPRDLALCAWDGSFTYAELDYYSEAVARHFVAKGWGQGAFIISKMLKSRWSMVAMLAILKAGCVFVPVDPRAPADRVAAIANEVSAKCLITNFVDETLPDFGDDIEIMGNLPRIAEISITDAEPLPQVAATALATAFFTSGSTGVPKGVLHEHQAICNGIRDVLRPFHIDQHTRCLQFASPAFDVTMSETLTILYAGGCVCIPNGQEVVDDINASMAKLRVTHAFLTPTVAAQVEPTIASSLRYLIVGGEPLRKSEVISLSPKLSLINTYGGTEMGIWETSTLSLTHESDSRNVGHTVGAKIWIVHPHNHDILLPIGMPGEVLVESIALARGYYRPVDRRAFIDEPKWRGRFPNRNTARFYLSGDLGQYEADGTLMLLGRKDTQVKLRGHRIELGEVEHHLGKSLPGQEPVAEVVKDLASSKGSTTLVAFVVFPGSEGEQPSEQQLAAAAEAKTRVTVELSRLLPAYMIPAVLIPIPSVPLTVSGKTDRRVLRLLAQRLSSSQLSILHGAQGAVQALETEAEHRLQSVWSSTLDLDPTLIGKNTSFFELGADSIAAMKAASAARAIGLPLGLSDFFRYPKLSDLAKFASEVSTGAAEKQVAPFSLIPLDAALELRREAAQQCNTSPADVEDLYPCTPLQEGLISLSSKHDTSEAYISRKVFNLPNHINMFQFEEAWNITALAHPILRTRLVNTADQGMLQAVVRGPLSWNFGNDLDAYLAGDAQQPMTFGTLLCRYALIDVDSGAQRSSVFVWTIHHSIYDGLSMSIIQDAFWRAYSGQNIAPSPPFGNFIKFVNSIDTNASQTFWKSYLDGPDLSFFPPVPSSISTPKPDSTVVREFPWTWKPTNGLNASTLLKTAWAIVAGRYSGSRDVIFGNTLSGRNTPVTIPGLDVITGPTIATVPIRIRWEPKMTIMELLEAVQRQESDMRHFEQTGLQNISRISSDARGACQFSCLFLVQPPPTADQARLEEVFGVENRDKSSEYDDHPLSIECEMGKHQLRVIATFDSRVLHEERLERIVTLFQQTVLYLSSNSQSQVSSLNLVTDADIYQIQEWNAIPPTVVRRQAHDLFRHQARLRSTHTALSSWDGVMTYAQLDGASDRLAGHLHALGVGPDVLVPICFEKSIWAVVAMLGVLKAGGAFAVVEPSHPLDRKEVIVRQLGAKVAVVAPSTESLFPSGCRPLPNGSPDNAMYVIFTSGSTGTPKGCVTEHWAFCSAMYEFGRDSGLRSDGQVLQFASYSFDTSSEEIFCTLFAGATLHIPSEASRINDLAGEIRRTKTNWAELNPKVASLLTPEEVPSLKTIILGGDRSHGSDVSRWPESTNLLNSYGCTEASVTSTLIPLNRRSNEEPPIGKGVGCNLWVVDPDNHDKLVPVGAPGELLIEGPGLARGYLGDPERTAKSFIFDPAWSKDGSGRRRRFYKTGDLVHANDEGAVFYHGRKDTQIKLRGQRVELGEIEHQLAQALPEFDVSAEIATMQANSQAPDTLVGFIVFPNDEEQSAEVTTCLDATTVEKLVTIRPKLIADLSRSLPAYMVPTLFVPMNRMPLTISAKADRRKLRALAQGLSPEDLALLQGTSDVKEQPQSQAEANMQTVWAGVLGVKTETIGLDDNFFRIGGDSITAMKMVPAARQFGLHISVAHVFRAPILRDLASQAAASGQQSQIEKIPVFSLINQGEKESIIVEVAKQCGVRPEEVEDVYPCTPLQEGLMSLSAKQHGSYIMRQVLVLSTDIRMADFHQAWEQVVQAHPILRTRIVSVGSNMYQAITTRSLSWDTSIDLDHYIAHDDSREVEFGAPLSRYAIIPYYDRFFFVWTLHHCIYDGWSLPLLLSDLSKAYNKISHGDSDIPGFNAFIKHLNGLDKTESDTFWSSYLEGPSTTFPASLLPNQTAQPSATHDESMGFAVNAIDGITSSTILRAAWALLTRSYTGDSDVVFGMTVNGRNAPVPGIDRMSGPTIATVPVRVRWDSKGSTTIRSLLESVQQDATTMIPFEQTGLQHISRLHEDAQAACQFGTLFVVQQDDSEEDEAVASIMELYDASEDTSAQFTTQPLLVECVVGASSKTVTLRMSYDPKLLDSFLVSGMAKQFRHILSQLVETENLDKPIGDLHIINPADHEQVIKWNEGRVCPIQKTMHDLVGAATVVNATRPAISAWDGEMTYAELESASSQVAGRLRSVGVGSSGQGEMVLLCFEKSRWAIVSALAILKAGAAFVALDPAQPNDRLATIMKLSKARLVLTSKGLEERLTRLSKNTPNVVCTSELVALADTAAPFVKRHRASGSDALVKGVFSSPEDLAYVIFTSGSTGVPKGVMISHRAASSSMMAHAERFGVDSSSRTLQFSSLTFDACIFEIFTTLATGGCICMPSDAQRVDDLAAAINSYSINTVMLTPSVLALLSPEDTPSLHSIIFIAEQVTDNDISRWSSQCRIQNGYGPTECTVVCVVNPDLRDGGRIGHAVGCRAWVVDADNIDKLVPIGCAGELLIEGPSLAIGYLNDAERTAESFIFSPAWALSDEPSATRRFYRTGDLVRQTSNGSFIYLGRKDTQVKLRGQRIELGEIDFHIRRALPSATVRSDIVDLQQQKAGSGTLKALAAFVVLEGVDVNIESNAGISADSLKQVGEAASTAVAELARSVPLYMVPSIFIPISKMPLTVSGKTDRQKLKIIAAKIPHKHLDTLRALQRGATGDGPKVAPRNDVERRMQSAWSTVLQLDPESIGTNDSFFRLGGDSISAMKLVTAARSVGISITVSDIFQTPVLANLCRCSSNESDEIELIAPFSLIPAYDTLMHQEAARQCGVAPEALEDLYPCTPLQQGLISLSVKEEGSYIVREIFRLRSVRVSRFQKAWEYVANIHPILRTQLVHLDTYGTLQAVISTKQAMRWRTASSLEEYLAQDEKETMGLGTALSRYGLVLPTNPADDAIFIWTAHHAMYDGWSMPIIKEAVATAYMEVMLPEAPAFNTFIKHIQGVDATAAQSFWKSYFDEAGASPFPAVPHGSSLEFRADRSEKVNLSWKSQQRDGVTVSTLLRAAYAIVVGTYTSSSDVVFGTTLSGRNVPVPRVETIVGPTITTVPVRLSWDANMTAEELLQNAQRQATEMMPFEQMGLVNIAKISESAKLSCQFQSIFVVQPERDDDSPACESLFGDQLSNTSRRDEAASPQTYPLGIEATVENNELELSATYDSRIIDPPEMRRILHQIGHAASLLDQNPNVPISALNLAGKSDLSQIQAWNARGPPAGAREAVYTIIGRNPSSAPAVSAWDGDLSYADLTRLSNGLAHRLRSMGVGIGAETVVAFSHGKSKWIPVIMLGILKAGGAFVALDAAQPESRLKFIVEEARISVLLTSPELAKLPSLANLPVTPVFPASLEYSTEEKETTPPPAHSVSLPDSLAYVVFTSGSTGVPKGVMVSHSATASSTLAHGSAMGITSESRVLQFASYTFDASVLEVLGTLLAGACVCIPSPEEASEDLNAAVRKYGVDFAALSPRVASLLRPKEVPAIKAIALGAEVVTSSDIQRWEGRRVSNGYGPTECTVVCVLESNNHKPGRIGRGVGCICWIVDPEDPNKLAPVGAPGELLIEGPCLARGYLHQEEKTRAAFVQDLAWTRAFPNPGSRARRFYKTGDIVRYDSDGGILFIGRKDNQAKLRGQRIELSEVEHHMRRAMPECHIVADIVSFPQQKNDSMALVAFVVPSSSKASGNSLGSMLPLDSKAVKAFAQSWSKATVEMSHAVPLYMVPTLYIPLDAIPLTSSSKVDRRRLQAIVADVTVKQLELLRGVQGVKEAPRSSLEKSMVSAWAQVLGLDTSKIGIRDSFFRLGGDSITAMRLVPILAEGGLTLRVSDVFKYPVLASLCRHLQGDEDRTDGSSSTDEWSDLGGSQDLTPDAEHTDDGEALQVAIADIAISTEVSSTTQTSSSSPAEYHITPASDFQALAFEFSQLRNRGFVNYFVLRFLDRFSHERIRNACTQLVQHHSILRTKLKLANGRLWQLAASESSFQPAFEFFRVTSDDVVSFTTRLIETDEARRLGSDEIPTKFFIVESASQTQLVMRLAHTHYDGLSFPLLLQTLSQALKRSELAPEVSFAKFSSSIQALPSRQSLSYWRRLLDNSQMTPVITPAAITANDGIEGHITRLVTLPNLSQASVTFASVLKAAWAIVLAQHSSLSDVVFGCLVSGRFAPVPGIESVVGPCVNLSPVRVNNILKNTSTRTFLQAVHAQHTKSMEHEHVGFRRIITGATSWPARTSFAGASIVQHQNIPLAAELNETTPDLPFELSAKGGTSNAAAIWIITTSRPSEGLLSIELTHALNTINHNTAETLLQALCVAIEHFGHHWDSEAPLPDTRSQKTRTNNVPLLPGGPSGNDDESVASSDMQSPDEHARAVVNQAWSLLQKAHSRDTSSEETPTSMFEVWNDNLVAVALKGIYESLDVFLDLEQLLQHPTRDSQAGLLASLGF
ncbi:hypothetical protein BDP67DRAFT_624154 [Colletotrichum lupini]|nr:hypothetical protein BDP67DRAFT_624154 [Colletotrichum lupini]